MTSAPKVCLSAALGATCALTTAGTAGAETEVGLLSVTVTPAITLAVDGATGSGTLGTTTVVDSRLGSTGYQVSVSTDGFGLVGAQAVSEQTHIPPSATRVRVSTASGGAASSSAWTGLPSASPVFALTYPSPVGLLPVSSSYVLSMELAVPSTVAPGRYAGTVTQSLV